MRRLQLGPRLLLPGTVDYTLDLATDHGGSGTLVSGSGRLQVGVLDWLTIGGEALMNSNSWQPKSLLDGIQPEAIIDLWLGGSTSASLSYYPRRAVVRG